jgi:hypothetical protein
VTVVLVLAQAVSRHATSWDSCRNGRGHLGTLHPAGLKIRAFRQGAKVPGVNRAGAERRNEAFGGPGG